MIDEDITSTNAESDTVPGAIFKSPRASVQIVPSDTANYEVLLQASVARKAASPTPDRVWTTIGTFTQADLALTVVDITTTTAYRFTHMSGSAVRVIMAA